jgi:hypothetical protein
VGFCNFLIGGASSLFVVAEGEELGPQPSSLEQRLERADFDFDKLMPGSERNLAIVFSAGR